MTCARCGAENLASARFCSTCGAALTDAPREERRIVTVLFGDLSGFVELSEARDTEEVKAIVDGAFQRCAQIVGEYGGRIDKIIGDEIMAVFGAPQAHEDDAERAVRAGLSIQRDMSERSVESERERGIPLRLHIGINTGEVVAGFVGGSDSYTVLGDAVNTARRIEDAAGPAQILVGQTTYEATREAIEYRRVEPVTAKGKRLPVAVWEALTERDLPGRRASRTAPLVGRDEELALLDSLASIVRRDRRPLVATMVGDAGLGKSRLATESARRAEARGMRVLHGRALPYGTATPASAIDQLVRQALRLDPFVALPDGIPLDRLTALFENDADAERARTLLAPAGARHARDAGTPGPTGAQPSSSPFLEGATMVLAQLAERDGPLTLVMHELHWAEDEVLDWIEHVRTEHAFPTFIVCLARPELLERRPDWSSGVGSTLIPIAPLPRARAAQLLDVLAPALPPALREGVLDRAGGNPFYLEELSRLIVDTPESFQIPTTLHALVTARLDALSPVEKRLLQDAAVIGERFWPGAVQRLNSFTHEQTMEAGRSLELQGFIEHSGAEDDVDQYRFRQTIVREVAYASVPKHVRAQQHEDVAVWLEERVAARGGDPEFDDLIAYHYERAAILAREIGTVAAAAEKRAREYLRRAGDHALGRDATTSASSFYTRALALAPDDGDIELRIQLAETLVALLRHETAEDQLEEALNDARRAGDRHSEAKALRLIGDSKRMRGVSSGAAEPLSRALEIARSIGDKHEEAEGLRSHGLLDLMQGKWVSAIDWFEQATTLYRELKDTRGQGWATQNLGWACMLMGRFDDALRYFEQGEGLFRELNDEEGAGWCIGMRAWVLMMRGQIMEAGAIAADLEEKLTAVHPEYAQSIPFTLALQRILRTYVLVLQGLFDEAEALGRGSDAALWQSTRWAAPIAVYPRFVTQMFRRRFDLAHEEADAGEDAARAFGDPFYAELFSFARIWLAYEEGKHDDAEAAIDAMRDRGEVGARWAGSAGVRWVTANITRARGDSDAARAFLTERLGSNNLGLISTAWTSALLAELLAEAGNGTEAVELATRAARDAGEVTLARTTVLGSLARVHLTCGDAAAAERTVREELAMLEQTGWAVERARALGLLAQILDAQRRHDEAAEAFDQARALAASLPDGTDTVPLGGVLHG